MLGVALSVMSEEELYAEAKELRSPRDIVKGVASEGKLPVPNFAAGGVATPADASLLMQLGAESVFVGSGIFRSSDPAKFARAIVEAVTHYNEPAKLLEVSRGLGTAMPSISMDSLPESEKIQNRGW